MADYNILFQGPNPGERFAQAFQQGQQQARENKARAAMAELTRDPNNQQALQDLASIDPQSAQVFQQQRIELAKQQLAQHQENILKGAQIIRQLNPRDDATWQQAKAVAAQAGVDVSEVPDHYDPQYVHGIVSIADAFKPQQGMQGKDISVPQGGAVLHVNPDGTTKWTVMPNGDAPQALTDDQIRAMQGGQAGQPSPGGFPN